MMMMMNSTIIIMLILTLRRWLQAHSSSAPLILSLPCQQNHAYKADSGNDQDEIYLYGQMAFGTRQAWQSFHLTCAQCASKQLQLRNSAFQRFQIEIM